MNNGIRLVAAAALIVASCASPGQPAQIDAPIEKESAHYLVWWAVEEGGYTTALVRQNGDESEVLAESSGLFIATDGALWEWREEPVETSQVDCECAMERGVMSDGVDDACAVTREVPAVTLVEVDSDREIEVSTPTIEMEGEFETTPSPTGSFAGVITVTECSYIYGCGAAHGSSDCRFAAWDLADGRELSAADLVEPLSQADQISLLRSESDEQVEPESLIGLVEVDPTWSETGAASLVATYAAATCYACTDGEWSAYTFTAVDTNTRAKIAIEDAPPTVRETWRATQGARGWSRVAPDDVERARSTLE